MSNPENLPVPAQEHAISPFNRMMAAGNSALNAGAVAIEQERAIAEAQGKMILAQRFPRSMAKARADFLEACADPDFAATAFYTVKNRGSGPSIRFAEEIARCYRHMDYGHRELSRSDGKSEVEVYAWDMENNNFSRRQITVEHVLDTQDGPRKLKNQGDIDNRIANIASKQARGRILALMPKALVAAGIARCKLTLAGGGDKPLSERINGMVQAFAKFGVKTAHLEAYLGHSVDNTTVDELADLTGIHNAIKEGGKASEYFPLNDGNAADATASTAAAITQQAKQAVAGKSQRTAPKPPAEEKGKTVESAGNAAKETPGESGEKPAADAAAPAAAPASPPAANGAADDVF